MKNSFTPKISFLLVWLSLHVWGQSASRWIDMLSYHYIFDLNVNGNNVAAATDNAVFLYDEQSGEFQRFSTVHGLSGEKISAFHYHRISGKYFVAHQNGKIEIINPDGKVFRDNSLFTSLIPDEDKKIIAVTSHQNTLYLAMPYGITEYDIDKQEFGDTYYIGLGGMELQVNDILIFNGKIYAATDTQGIVFTDLSNPDKSDFTTWNRLDGGTWQLLRVFNNRIYGVKGNGIYEINTNSVSNVYTVPSNIKDLASDDSGFYVGFHNRVLKLNSFFSVTGTFSPTAALPFRVVSLTTGNGKLYIGTESHGILITSNQPPGSYRKIHPDSPLQNNPFSADIYDGQICVVYGDYTELYNPSPLDRSGISRYVDKRWKNIPYEDFQVRNLTDVIINPRDTAQFFAASFHEGLVEFRNGTFFQKFDNSNAPFPPIILQSGPYESYRISPVIFDDDGNLWAYQGLVMQGLHRYDLQGNWQSYSFQSIVDTMTNEGVAQMNFDREGNLWLATHRLGLVGFNPRTGDWVALTEQNNIPYEGSYRNTKAVAVDKDNILWVGTLNGLRILRNPARAFTEPSVQLERIIIELEELEGQDNQGVELLLNTEISVIEVDGANNKWVGTTNAGVFYFSEDGQQTIYRFTKENSPLPGNSIFDISIDPVTGIVLFATDRGLIGFKGDASEGKNNLDDAYVYPNPVVTRNHEYLIITNLMRDTGVKITDIEGNLVYETRSKGGSVRWDLKNFAGRKVASGVYLILLVDEEIRNTKVLKALIIN